MLTNSFLGRDGFLEMAKIDIPEFLEYMRTELHRTANEELDQQISLGNNAFTTAVDGKPVSGRHQIPLAQRNVRFNFLFPTVDLALSILKQEMERAIAATTQRQSGKLRASVRMWYGSEKRGLKEVSNSSEITEFMPGDYVALVPDIMYMPFVNRWVTKKTGYGFMRKAAQRIRNRIKQARKSAGVAVHVYHARYMIPLLAQDDRGRRVLTKWAPHGVPVMYIRLKRQEYMMVGEGAE